LQGPLTVTPAEGPNPDRPRLERNN
jgi:hypothetical protein